MALKKTSLWTTTLSDLTELDLIDFSAASASTLNALSVFNASTLKKGEDAPDYTAAETTLFTESFETDGNGTRYNASVNFADSDDDFFTRYDVTNNQMGDATVYTGANNPTNGNFGGQDGNFIWIGEDLDDNGGNGNDVQFVTFDNIDITGQTQINIKALFGDSSEPTTLGGWDDGDFVALVYRLDNGDWNFAFLFNDSDGVGTNSGPIAEVDLANINFIGGNTADSFIDGVLADPNGVDYTNFITNRGTGTVLTSTLAEFTTSFAVSGNTDLDIMLIAHADSSAEEFAFDNLRVTAGAPDQTLDGDGNNNVLVGGNGDDTLNGLGGNDKLEGGAGADIFNGGSGRDTARYINAAEGVIVNLATGGTGGEAAGDTYNSIERVTGSTFDDIITGDALANILRGYDGNDTLNGGDLNDRLFGNDGTDTLNGDEGNDILEGGAGGDILNGGNGTDTASYSQSTSSVGIAIDLMASNIGDALGDTFTSIERFILSEFGDIFVGSNLAAVNDFVRGGGGNDNIIGEDGDDRLFGEDGNDTLAGGSGIDRLYGGDGNDTMTGGSSRDAFYFEGTSGADIITDWTNGEDRLIFFSSTGVTEFSNITVTQQGSDVLLQYGVNSVTLENALATDVDASDFGFLA